MRVVKIKEKKGGRPLLGRQEFFAREIEDGLKGCIPGEWVKVEGQFSKTQILAMANPLINEGAPVKVLKIFSKGEVFPDFSDDSEVKKFLLQRLQESIERRNHFKGLRFGGRIIYGDQDGLPGVIADEYEKSIFLQINTAGMDRYRELIKSLIEDIKKKQVYFYDNEEYRLIEGLPIFSQQVLPDITVRENDIEFKITTDVMQKIGHYYDHRENRSKLIRWIKEVNSDLQTGVDLFSYCGAWGLNALKGGLTKMTFVDQGNFEKTINENLSLNNFSGKGHFVRENVFHWLKDLNKEFDVVISDPPAFSKSLKSKSKAIGGYQKLHSALVPIVKKGGLLAIGSCTSGVSLMELDQTVALAFTESDKRQQLIDIGIMGPDHPMKSLSDGGNYIKFLLYAIF